MLITRSWQKRRVARRRGIIESRKGNRFVRTGRRMTVRRGIGCLLVDSVLIQFGLGHAFVLYKTDLEINKPNNFSDFKAME